MRSIYVMFLDESFEFNPRDQTQELYSKAGVLNKRKQLIKAYLSALKSEMQGKNVE